MHDGQFIHVCFVYFNRNHILMWLLGGSMGTRLHLEYDVPPPLVVLHSLPRPAQMSGSIVSQPQLLPLKGSLLP